MSRKIRVLVGMSGGVDSSVAAALLQEQGYQVVGVTMKVYEGASRASSGRCCSLEDVTDARAVAEKLDIPYYVMDFVRPFREKVVEPFVDEYRRGRTPIPCVHCNREIKWGALLEKADRLRADFVATGHYARIDERGGRRRLLRGLDPAKDQSYFLFSLGREQLRRTLFPLGTLSKNEVRRRAEHLGLHLARKRESQEICFVPDGDYAGFLERHSPGISQPGPIVDSGGRLLGQHRGVVHYTIGQRRGLGVSAGSPLYVVQIEASERTLVVGSAEELECRRLVADGVNWIADHPGERALRVHCRIRSTHGPASCTLQFTGSARVEVCFDEPQRAVTPGQAAVFYRGDEVLGGGWIGEPVAES